MIACRIYFEDSKEAYEKKKAELGVTQPISFEDEERYRQTYVFESEKWLFTKGVQRNDKDKIQIEDDQKVMGTLPSPANAF